MADEETFEEIVRKEAKKRYSFQGNRDKFIDGAKFVHSIDRKRVKELEKALKECLEDSIQRCKEIGLNPDGYSTVIKANKALNQTP